MNKKGFCLSIACLFILWGFTSNAQNRTPSKISEYYEIVRLRSQTPDIILRLAPKNDGNTNKTSISDASARILISTFTPSEQTHRVSASVAPGSVPSGTILKLAAQQPNRHFKGDAGTIGSEVTLCESDHPIITAIGACYSGKALDDGYGLEYTYIYPSFSGGTTPIKGKTVTVTLTVSSEV
jgi:hypothetical protein